MQDSRLGVGKDLPSLKLRHGLENTDAVIILLKINKKHHPLIRIWPLIGPITIALDVLTQVDPRGPLADPYQLLFLKTY